VKQICVAHLLFNGGKRLYLSALYLDLLEMEVIVARRLEEAERSAFIRRSRIRIPDMVTEAEV